MNTFELSRHRFKLNFDFRSFLDTVGERTFEIKSWGTKDGYSTATVNWLESTDTAETEEEEVPAKKEIDPSDPEYKSLEVMRKFSEQYARCVIPPRAAPRRVPPFLGRR